MVDSTPPPPGATRGTQRPNLKEEVTGKPAKKTTTKKAAVVPPAKKGKK